MPEYETSPAVDAAISVLRRFVRMLISWDAVPDRDVAVLAKSLLVFSQFPRVNRRFNFSIDLKLPAQECDDGKRRLTWSIRCSEGEMEASIGGYFRNPDRGMDSMTTCELFAIPGTTATYDVYRGAHADPWLPAFDEESLRSIDLTDPDLQLEIEDFGDTRRRT